MHPSTLPLAIPPSQITSTSSSLSPLTLQATSSTFDDTALDIQVSKIPFNDYSLITAQTSVATTYQLDGDGYELVRTISATDSRASTTFQRADILSTSAQVVDATATVRNFLFQAYDGSSYLDSSQISMRVRAMSCYSDCSHAVANCECPAYAANSRHAFPHIRPLASPRAGR